MPKRGREAGGALLSLMLAAAIVCLLVFLAVQTIELMGYLR